MSNLPKELLKLLFSYLPDDRLDEYMKVCKSWYSVAFEKKYEEIKAYPISSQYIRNRQLTRIDGRKAVDFARICKFGFWRFYEEDFQELMRYLPNIRELKNIPQRCLPFLNNDAVLGRLTCLKEIDVMNLDGGKQSADLYFEINVKLKNQIISLTLVLASMSAWKNKCTELLTTLSGFHKLKHLRVYGCHEKRTGAIHLVSILDACSSLVSLDLYNTHNWNIDTTNSNVHTSLTSLTLSVGCLTVDHLKYMIHHLPNLKSFTLSMFKNTFEGVLASESPSFVNDAAMYFKKMKHLVITQTWSNKADGVDRPMAVLVFWEFLRILCDQDCYCDLEAVVSSQTDNSYISQFKKQGQNVFLKCSILLDSSNYGNWVQLLDFFIFESINLAYLRHTTQLTQRFVGYGWILQTLMALLKHQQNKQLCRIDIRGDSSESVKFSNVAQPSQQLFVEHGTISFIRLGSKLLRVLCQLFPLVKDLNLHQCIVEKVNKKDKTYQVDLSQFCQVQHLTFDLDKFIENETGRKSFYINLINTKVTDSFIEYYYFSGKTQNLENLGNYYNYKTKERYLIKIYHAGIENFTFRRYYREVPVVKYGCIV